MKNKSAYLLSWGLYWIGHIVSVIMNYSPEFIHNILYPVYNKTMKWSADIQDWGAVERGPWGDSS